MHLLSHATGAPVSDHPNILTAASRFNPFDLRKVRPHASYRLIEVGAMRVDGNQGGTIGHVPNRQGVWPDQLASAEPLLAGHGVPTHWDHQADDRADPADDDGVARAIAALQTA